MRPTGILPTTPGNHRIPRERSDTRRGGQCPRGGCGAQRREEYIPAAVFPIPIGSLGFPASPRLPPARKSPPGVPRRKVALSAERDESMQSCPRNDPPGTRASPMGSPGTARLSLGRHADQETPARRVKPFPPPGCDRPVKAAFSRNSSRRKSRPRCLAFHPPGRSRPECPAPEPKSGPIEETRRSLFPMDPVLDPVLPRTGEIITLLGKYRK